MKLRKKFINISEIDSSLPIPDKYIDSVKYNFRPSPDSKRPQNIPPDWYANAYSNDYTSLFYEWLKEVFFKFVWRDYILKRDNEGWLKRYDQFKSLSLQKQNAILTTTEGKLIDGFEYRELWQKQLLPDPTG